MKLNSKPIIYIDMDGVLVDFESALTKIPPEMLEKFAGEYDNIPGVFGMVLGFQFMDGTKVRASNSKNRNLTVSKSNNGIGRFGGHISECQRLSNERDVESDAVAANRLPRAELERWLAEVKLCLVCHEGHREWRGDGTVAAKVPTRGHYEFRKAVVLRLRPD